MSIFSTHKWNIFAKIGRKTAFSQISSIFKVPQKSRHTSYICGIPMKLKLRVSTFWKLYNKNLESSFWLWNSGCKKNLIKVYFDEEIIVPYWAIFGYKSSIYFDVFVIWKNKNFSRWNIRFYLWISRDFRSSCLMPNISGAEKKKNSRFKFTLNLKSE